jgi:hypothetical protein
MGDGTMENKTETKPVTIKLGGFSMMFLILSIPILMVSVIAFIFLIIGLGIVAVPIGLVIAVVVILGIKIIDWIT